MISGEKLTPDEQARVDAEMAKINAWAESKRGGRPIKEARKGKRSRISVDISAPTKALINSRAKASGRTLAREAEIMIEGFVTYQEMMERMRQTLDEMQRGNVEAALWRLGYTPVRRVIDGKAWKLWAEPNFPGLERSGFKP
jgi:hypothetical protein